MFSAWPADKQHIDETIIPPTVASQRPIYHQCRFSQRRPVKRGRQNSETELAHNFKAGFPQQFLGFDAAVVNDVINKVTFSEYKRRQAAPGLRVSPRAFGMGRRIPVAQKFRTAR